MRPALLLFYLAALMVKTDVTSDDDHDQEVFGAFLIFVLFVGPFMAIVEPFFEFICPRCFGLLRLLGCLHIHIDRAGGTRAADARLDQSTVG